MAKLESSLTKIDNSEIELDPKIDIAFSYKKPKLGSANTSIVFKEAVCPVCSPAFMAQYREQLLGPVTNWAKLPLLELTKTK